MRGRWNSLDSILAFGWCGSAVAGGFLLDAFGFDLTFLITAFFQVSRLNQIGHYLLIFLVPYASSGDASVSVLVSARCSSFGGT